jgi:hypothetical protein
MGYSVYYNGEIDISPELSDEHATLLDEALTKSNPALLGITAEDGQGLYHGCDWQLSGGRLSVEGESRGEQDEWLRLLIVRFFQPNGYTLSGEVSWEGVGGSGKRGHFGAFGAEVPAAFWNEPFSLIGRR